MAFAGGAARLVDDPGAVFIGTVNGGNDLTNVLELASGSSAGTLAGLGTQFRHFAGVTVDAGAAWTLSGANTIASGYTLSDAGTLTNAGTLINNGAATVTAAFINSGTVSGNAITLSGGQLTNAVGGSVVGGGIYGSGTGGADTVTNFGSISGASSGIVLAAGGTITDGGAIAGGGGTAISFGAGGDLLVLEHGYAITGGISAAGSGNVVELLGTSSSAAVTATYNSLGLTGFQTAAFAPGAGNYADLVITNDATLPGTIAGFIGVHDTIDLTALSDAGNNATTSFNSITHQLTVTAGGTSVTLLLDNEDYAGVHWVAQNDGSNGTEILPSVAVPPVITGTVANQGDPNQNPIDPFAGVTITDPTGNGTVTATVTLSAAGNGTLSNLGGGSYSGGVYSDTGSASAVTSAIDALVFTPAAPASGVYVTTTGFTIGAAGAGGSSSDSKTTVTAVVQVLGLAAVPTNQIVISVSPDGSSFAVPTLNDTNEAVVTMPSGGTTYTLPAGYQAEYLGGSAAATLQDLAVGNAVLVGNTGSDTLTSAAANDLLVGGNGNNVLLGGVGTIALEAGNGNEISAQAGLDLHRQPRQRQRHGLRDRLGHRERRHGRQRVRRVAAGGHQPAQFARHRYDLCGRQPDHRIITGSGGLLEGGNTGGTLTATITGGATTVYGNAATTSITTSGSGGKYIGGSGSLFVTDDGTTDTVAGAGGAVTVSAAAASPFVYGGSGSLLGTRRSGHAHGDRWHGRRVDQRRQRRGGRRGRQRHANGQRRGNTVWRGQWRD